MRLLWGSFVTFAVCGRESNLSSRPFRLLFQEEGWNFPNQPPMLCLDSGGELRFTYNFYTYSGDHAATLIPSFDKEVDTPSTFIAVKEWLQNCHCIFKLSEPRPFQPTRVLDIGNEGQDHVTLIETRGIIITSYACLSYCWGGSQPLVNSTQRKPSSDEWAISIHELPKTFEDFIKTLRRLDFRYAWIDSLCIIQDDLNDKEREIKQMPNIYKNSDLTLCASTAHSCNEGFLQPRPDYSEHQLQLIMPNNKVGTLHFNFSWDEIDEIDEPLDTRAWALQERLLSPRLLEYGQRTSRWSCSCTKGYGGHQHFPTSARSRNDSKTAFCHNYMFNYLSPQGIRDIAQRKDQLYDCWERIVRQYTRRKLTFQDDRLAAIAGVASELQERTGVPYLAGLWDHETLPFLLLWRNESLPHQLDSRPTITCAPSWSWAAVNASVTFSALYTGKRVDKSFSVLSTNVSGGFGMSASGSVTVEGPVRRGSEWYKDWDFTKYSEKFSYRGYGYKLDIYPDFHGEILQFQDDITLVKSLDLSFIVVVHHPLWIAGLILSKKDETNHTRVGLFEIYGEESFIADWSVERLTIV
ncbi:heterokaryon incompatibility protein-domain-containing protein [Hypoxylon sp. FL1150]|nr:heterokaryon incompatibility protein-domain-containing protein [Hypoxylon sp. FL1150]